VPQPCILSIRDDPVSHPLKGCTIPQSLYICMPTNEICAATAVDTQDSRSRIFLSVFQAFDPRIFPHIPEGEYQAEDEIGFSALTSATVFAFLNDQFAAFH